MGLSDVFVKDLTTGTTTRVSTDAAGAQANGGSYSPRISGDGRYVAFSKATPATWWSATPMGLYDIFVKDLTTGTTTRVSTDSAGGQADDSSYRPEHQRRRAVRRVFQRRRNLVVGDTNGLLDVFVKDLTTGTTTRVSTDAAGVQAGGGSYYPSISADGRYVAF